MEREIKFRAWQKAHKKMLTWEGFFRNTTVEDAFNNPQYVLMQFTGLKDKNGKEIYEGDIVEYLQMFGSSKTDEWNREKGIVRWWKDGWLPFVWENDMSGDDDWYSNHQKDYRIIGNIYESPNLIKDNN